MTQEENETHFRITFQELDPKPQHVIVKAETFEKAVHELNNQRWESSKPIHIIGGHEIDPNNEKELENG